MNYFVGMVFSVFFCWNGFRRIFLLEWFSPYFFVGRGFHRLPIIRRHSVTLPAGGVRTRGCRRSLTYGYGMLRLSDAVHPETPVQADLQSAVAEY